jgi:hypothetical protein
MVLTPPALKTTSEASTAISPFYRLGKPEIEELIQGRAARQNTE